MSSKAYKNLGEILIEMGALQPEALTRALRIQSRRLGQILIDERLADAALVAQALKLQASSTEACAVGTLRIPSDLVHGLLGDLDAVLESLPSEATQARYKVLTMKRQFSALLVAPAASLLARARDILSESLADEGQGKSAVLEASGAEFSLDQALVSELADMLVHLVRNAVYHGIESVEARTAAGKVPAGLVSVGLSLEAGGLALRVTDDGCGINVAVIEGKARAMGLSGHWKQALFTPGFSTKESATLHAGRGIGLDVVESAVLRLKGTLDVESTVGKGTTFAIKVPLTFASVPTLVTRYAEQWVLFQEAHVAYVGHGPGTHAVRDLRVLFEGEPQTLAFPHWVIDTQGNAWGVHEVLGVRDVFVSGVARFLGQRYGIIATGCVEDLAVEALLVDLKSIQEFKRP